MNSKILILVFSVLFSQTCYAATPIKVLLAKKSGVGTGEALQVITQMNVTMANSGLPGNLYGEHRNVWGISTHITPPF